MFIMTPWAFHHQVISLIYKKGQIRINYTLSILITDKWNVNIAHMKSHIAVKFAGHINAAKWLNHLDSYYTMIFLLASPSGQILPI